MELTYTKVIKDRFTRDELHIIREIFKHGGFVAGGAARYAISTAVPLVKNGDIDIYAENTVCYDSIYSLLCDLSSDSRESMWASTFSVCARGKITNYQLVKPKNTHIVKTYGDPETVIKYFDFTIVTAAMVTPDLVMHDTKLQEHEQKRLLIINNIITPLQVFYRAIKYGNKGYFMPFTEALKLFNTWENLQVEQRQAIYRTVARLSSATPEDIEKLEVLLGLAETDESSTNRISDRDQRVPNPLRQNWFPDNSRD